MYPIRSNIFTPGSDLQGFFNRYPIQVSVLHRPKDILFADTLQELALSLHRSTGEHIVFFPLIDPPQNWVNEVRGTPLEAWWQREHFFGQPFDDVLVSRLSSFFGLEWSELPALIISPSLWKGGYITLPTGPDLIESQLEILTNLVKKKRMPIPT